MAFVARTLSKMATDIELRAINTVRVLSADIVEKANSGHPGAFDSAFSLLGVITPGNLGAGASRLRCDYACYKASLLRVLCGAATFAEALRLSTSTRFRHFSSRPHVNV